MPSSVAVYPHDSTKSPKYVYDAANLLTKITDPGENVIEIFYDKLGRRKDLYDPDAGQYAYEYDSNGNLEFLGGPNGDVTWTYDVLDRPKTRTGGDAGNVTWTYDVGTNAKGFLDKRTDGASTYDPNYDLLGRVTGEMVSAGGRNHNFSTDYDPLGQVVSRMYPWARRVNWIRDAKGFLTAIENNNGQTEYATNIQWDAQGRLLSWTDGNADNPVQTIISFDEVSGRVQGVQVGIHEHLQYTFDKADRLLWILDDGADIREFRYDDLNRLTYASGPFRSGVDDVLEFDYDDLGNLTCLGASSLTNCQDGTQLTYPPPGPTAVQPHAPLQINGEGVTHDPAGNLEAWGSRAYVYDALGALRTVKENTVTKASMSYDANGRMGVLAEAESGETRYLVTEDFEYLQTSKLSRIHIFLAGTVIASDEATYDPTPPPPPVCHGSPPALEVDWRGPLGLLAPGLWAFLLLQVGFAVRRRPQGARLRPVLAAGTAGVFLVATSIPLPGLVPEARAAVTPTGITYYHGDHLGSSVVITNGTNVEQVLYRPFGQAAPASDAVPEFGFTGQRYVDSIGIYDYGARWYDPALGRFLQADPVIADTSNPQAINPYSYVLNSPLNYTDPSGMYHDDPYNPRPDEWCDGYDHYEDDYGDDWDDDSGLGSFCLWGCDDDDDDSDGSGYSYVPVPQPEELSKILTAGNYHRQTVFTILAGLEGMSQGGNWDESPVLHMPDQGGMWFDMMLWIVGGKAVTSAGRWLFGGIAGRAGAAAGATTGAATDAAGNAVRISEYTLGRAAQRGISQSELRGAIESGERFLYRHAGQVKTGYYHPSTRVFVGSVEGNTTTVLRSRSLNYIENLRKTYP